MLFKEQLKKILRNRSAMQRRFQVYVGTSYNFTVFNYKSLVMKDTKKLIDFLKKTHHFKTNTITVAYLRI